MEKAVVLIRQALKKHREGNIQEEIDAQEVILNHVVYSKDWLSQRVEPEELDIIQYLYILNFVDKREILTKIEYEEIFKKECFKDYVKKEEDIVFEQALEILNRFERIELLKQMNICTM